jgi:hypothetical protein
MPIEAKYYNAVVGGSRLPHLLTEHLDDSRLADKIDRLAAALPIKVPI